MLDVVEDFAPAPRPALLTPAELADQLRVSSRTVQRLTDDGMPHVLVGDSRRYRLDAVLTWLEGRGAR